MITPLSLTLEHFGSFLKEQTFTFPREPGLYLMLGKNEVEPRLAGNATGKTTLWNALTWLLHEKTAAGLKAGDVCTWDVAGKTRVEFDFYANDDDTIRWTCRRTWKPNTWTLACKSEIHDEDPDVGFVGPPAVDLAKDPQNPVLDALRLHFDAWLCAVLMAQGEDYFLDMAKTKQAELFGSVMDLEEWERRADRASKAATQQLQKVEGLSVELSRAEGMLEMVDPARAQELHDAWERQRRERLDRFEEDHANLMRQRKAFKNTLDAALALADDARGRLARVKDGNTAIEDEYDLVCANVRKHEDKLLKLKVEADALVSHQKQLDNSNGKCPVCGSELDTRHYQDEMRRAERVALGLQAEVTSVTHALDIIKKRRDVLEVDIDEMQDAERDLNRIEADLARSRTTLEQCDKNLDRVEDMAEQAEKEKNPYAEELRRARDDYERLYDKVDDLRYALNDAEAIHYIRSMWVKGFKEIRLREIASALSELEVEVNSAVTALGLMDWQLEFHVDKESKSGTLQRGFHTTVRAPGAGDKAVPWEAWSGGEKQRLRIAGNAGLSDMVRARTGCDFALEVWDEPTTGLSPEGKIDLFQYLADRARNERRVIFLLDHQARDFGGFAGTCTIVKTSTGSRIRTSW